MSMFWPLLLSSLSYIEEQGQQQASVALTPADAPHGRFAWVSSLCGDASYVPAAAVLGHSLRKSNTTHDMVLLVTGDIAQDGVTLDHLRTVGWKVRIIEHTLQSPVDDRGERGKETPRFRCFFTKLRAFGLVDYEQVVLLDSDTAVFQNADELFERWPRPPNKVAAVPNDRYPTVEVNTGVLVLRPSPELADALDHHVRSGAPIEWDGADQGLINQWFFGKIDYLPPFYNMMNSASSDPYTMDWLLARHKSAIKIVHYVNNKPMWCGRNTECTNTGKVHIRKLVNWWWALYDEMSWKPPGKDIYGRHFP